MDEMTNEHPIYFQLFTPSELHVPISISNEKNPIKFLVFNFSVVPHTDQNKSMFKHHF